MFTFDTTERFLVLTVKWERISIVACVAAELSASVHGIAHPDIQISTASLSSVGGTRKVWRTGEKWEHGMYSVPRIADDPPPHEGQSQ